MVFIIINKINCGGPEVTNPSRSNYLELVSQAGSATFNFNTSLTGNAGNICLDLGVCTANVDGSATSLYISYRSTNSRRWSSDLSIAFYGTGQSFGGCCGTAGTCAASTQIGSFPDEYNHFVNYNIQINSGFSPALAFGFTAICIANTCASGTCTDTNRFYGTFVLSNLNCSAPPATTGHPIIVPIEAPTSPTVNPTMKPTYKPSAEPSVKPSSEPTSPPTGPSTAPSNPNPTYDPTNVEVVGERK
jgi:hypothetical protein